MSKKDTVEYHKMMFERLCTQLNGYTETIIISFLDLKKNTVLNQKKYQYRVPTLIEMRTLAKHFSKIAEQYNMKVQTCAEEVDLREFGV